MAQPTLARPPILERITDPAAHKCRCNAAQCKCKEELEEEVDPYPRATKGARSPDPRRDRRCVHGAHDLKCVRRGSARTTARRGQLYG